MWKDLTTWVRAVGLCAQCPPRLSDKLLRTFGCTWSATPHPALPAAPAPVVYAMLNQEGLLASLAIGAALERALGSPCPFVVNLAWTLHPFGWRTWSSEPERRYIIHKWMPSRFGQGKRVIERCAADMRAARLTAACISLEGKRMRSAQCVHPYRKGAAVLAVKAGAHVVPVATRGGFQAMPYGQWRVARGQHISVKFFAPIPPGLSVDEIMRRVRELT